jgi:hypothetical protein
LSPATSDEGQMAEKRSIGVSGPDRDEQREEDDLPQRFKHIGWKEWLKVDLARYWFVIIALAVDVFFGMEATKMISRLEWLGPAIFLAIAIPIEVFIYLYLWGKKGILMIQK